jgi:two-component system nitrogen regulation response regulator GlnG
MARLLMVDDQDRYATLVRRALPEHELVGPARSWAEAKAALRRLGRGVDVVLLDVHFDIPEADLLGLPESPSPKDVERARRQQGLHILEALRGSHPDLAVLLMTSRDDLPLEQAAERHHAEEYTYFLDDDLADADALRAQIANILAAQAGEDSDGPVFWGRNPALRRLRAQLLTLARGRLPIILGGPTGTGKSLIARHFIHPRSGREGRFVSVDLSTMPKDLVTAHLFGAARGSYTGAVADRKGAFEEASGGTLFLDEIGNLAEDVQKMLLTVLQEGVVTRLGDMKERAVDVKLVVATHEDLPALVRQGRFRADLYMRLNPACTVTLPPLRERLRDLNRLIEESFEKALAGPYLRELVEVYTQSYGLSGAKLTLTTGDEVPDPEPGLLWVLLPQKALALLRRHPGPGNLRELVMTIENALVFSFAELAQLREVERPDLVQLRPKLIRDLLRTGDLDTNELPADGWRVEVSVRAAESLNEVALDIERQYFTAMWRAYDGDFRELARCLMNDPDCARKVQLRFNQLGLKVRDLRGRAES